MRALLVDDERLARAELRRLLAAHADIEIIGEAVNAADAVQQIVALQPELVFLDVQMPGGNGFDVLAALDCAPHVIFTTAYDQYAMQAFEVNALDYLQKPIQATRLAAALGRLGLRQTGASAAARKMFIKDGERCWFVELDQIRLCESEGNYSRVFFHNEQALVAHSLNRLEDRLSLAPQQFFRTSRKHIVNLNFVQRITSNANGGLELLLPGQLTVEVSRRRATQFRQLSDW
ncbi:LytR/AlgR family response regulator transcription factor [Rugamonas apoptosis]|uniref:Response regulator n=1 Tax=Rugamonas apoptosis TaxID=2758570 RepID=A0A7W2IMW8_9BURK|nr:response regulator [Rugamonas apoptosis]MBA5690123.1 response regulator [Rugamonas apoptosis]